MPEPQPDNPSPTVTSVIHCDSTTSSSLTSPRVNNTQENGHQAKMPLGVELTGYRLLTTVVILGVGIAKSVYQGQALISTSLDWLGGVIFALM
jgi:hypothetical protein